MKDTVLVFGSGRSGTSWLSETMARPKGYRLLFEPEHEDHVPEGRVLTDRLLIPGNEYKDADRFIKKLLCNRIDNDWIAQHSFRKFKVHLWPFLVKRKIVKFVRCNLGMHYMANKFNAHIVYLHRNPYSTIFSQNRVQFPWLTDLRRFQQQQILCESIYKSFGFDLMQSKVTDLQKLTIRWAIENIFPFKYFDSSNLNAGIIQIEYDEFIKSIDSYQQFLSKVNLQPPPDLEKEFIRPSSKTHPKSTILSGSPAKYEKLFERSQLDEINEVLNVFGFENRM